MRALDGEASPFQPEEMGIIITQWAIKGLGESDGCGAGRKLSASPPWLSPRADSLRDANHNKRVTRRKRIKLLLRNISPQCPSSLNTANPSKMVSLRVHCTCIKDLL